MKTNICLLRLSFGIFHMRYTTTEDHGSKKTHDSAILDAPSLFAVLSYYIKVSKYKKNPKESLKYHAIGIQMEWRSWLL